MVVDVVVVGCFPVLFVAVKSVMHCVVQFLSVCYSHVVSKWLMV